VKRFLFREEQLREWIRLAGKREEARRIEEHERRQAEIRRDHYAGQVESYQDFIFALSVMEDHNARDLLLKKARYAIAYSAGHGVLWDLYRESNSDADPTDGGEYVPFDGERHLTAMAKCGTVAPDDEEEGQ